MGASRVFDLGSSLPRKNSTVLLELTARLDSDGLSGSMFFMMLKINNRLVGPHKTHTLTRVVNRKLKSPVASGTPHAWFSNQAWRVLYAPDFESALALKFYEGNPYETVLDVTDLLDSAGKNRLEITNVCKYDPPSGSAARHELIVKKLAVRIKPGTSPLMVADVTEQEVISRGMPGAGPVQYRGALLPGGGFQIGVAGRTYHFDSRVSYPNAGMNELSAGHKRPADTQARYRLTTMPAADGGRVVVEGPEYRFIRTVRFTARKVDVADEIINLNPGAKLGLWVENTLRLTQPAMKVRLAGIPDPSVSEYYSPGNPSVYVSLPDIGLGLICEDDIFRNQATLFVDSTQMTAGMRTDKLCISAGSAYTLRWSVYPVASHDYYDFINLVREDWGSNYTVEGAWTFFNADAILATPIATLRDRFAKHGIKRACSGGGWVDHTQDRSRIGFGAGVLEDYWTSMRNRLLLSAQKIKEAVPDCKVYVYYNTQRDTSDLGRERFQDSLLANENGEHISTDWGGKYNLTQCAYATTSNSFGRAMLSAVDRYMNDMKIDGLYWDEMEATGYGKALVAYNAQDGYSCELDRKSFTIHREIGINTLLGEEHRLAVIKRLRALGGDFMGNGPTCTKKILAFRPQRMVEIQHNERWSYEGNLDSPLGYAGARTDFANWIRALKMATLLVGTGYHYDYDIQRYIFPFTPIELHAGYLLGKERIIATHNGEYGWPGAKWLVQIRFFDNGGRLACKDFATKVAGEARTSVEVGDGEAVVLVKIPVNITSARYLVVRKVQYSSSGLKFVFEAEGGFSIEIHGGEMMVTPGKRFLINVDGKSLRHRADERGLLRFDIDPHPGSRELEILPEIS